MKRAKRAPTSYSIFYKERVAQIKETNGSMAFGEISKKMADEWKSLSEEQRRPYVEQSKKEHLHALPSVLMDLVYEV